MKKVIGYTVAVILLAMAAYIGVCIYSTANISGTLPPIKVYQFSGNIKQLVNGIRECALKDHRLTFRITDTTGNKRNGYAIYMTVETENVEYSLECEKRRDIYNGTEIRLVGAHDNIRNVGGYSESAKGIDSLVNQFNLNVLKSLNDKQHIKITSNNSK